MYWICFGCHTTHFLLKMCKTFEVRIPEQHIFNEPHLFQTSRDPARYQFTL